MRNIILICSLIMCSTSFAFETTSVGISHIETVKETGRKILWVTGDTAKDLYEALVTKDGYTEKEDSRISKATTLSDDNNFNDWYCIRINVELEEFQKQSGMTKYNCRTIPVAGN